MTAAIALAKLLYPIASVPDAQLEAWYGWAVALVGSTAWGSLQTQGIAHLLGHAAEMWARSTSGGTSLGGGSGSMGSITSVKSSTMAMATGAAAGFGSWVPTNAGDAAFAQTPGGQAYMALRDSIALISAPFVV